MPQIVAGSVLLGLASAVSGPITAIPSEVLPHKYRSAGQGLIFAMSILGPFPALLGPAYAIKRSPTDGWRWIYYSGLIGYGLSGLLWMAMYRPPPRKNEYTDEKRPSPDWIGYALLTIGAVLFLMGLTWGGAVYPWTSAQVLSTTIIGIFSFIALGIWSWKGRSDGLLHHDLFKQRNFPLAMTA